MQTPIQELISKISSLKSSLQGKTEPYFIGQLDALSHLESSIKELSLLEKEKQRIMKAFFDGTKSAVVVINTILVRMPKTLKMLKNVESGLERWDDGEEYYKTTYKQD